MRKIILILIMLVLVSNSFAYYPPTIYRKSVDAYRMNTILESIPEKMFNNIDSIEFSNLNRTTDDLNIEGYSDSYSESHILGHYNYNYKYNKKSGDISTFTNSQITITQYAYSYTDSEIRCIILHELGHHYSYRTLRTNTNHFEDVIYSYQEQVASDYAVNYEEGCEWLYT